MYEEYEQYSFDVSNVTVGIVIPVHLDSFYLLFGATASAAGTSFGITVTENSK